MQTAVSKGTRDISLENLKALMMLCIFTAHSTSCFRYCGKELTVPLYVYSQIMFSLTTVLSAFFFLSGYFSSLPEKGSFVDGYFAMIKKKITSLAVPYFLWNGIYIAIFLIGSLFVPAVKQWATTLSLNTPWGILDALLGITYHPADGPLWYLRNILIISVLFYPFLRCAARKIGILLPIGVFLLLTMIDLGFDLPDYVQRYHLAPYSAAAFCFGVFAREKGFRIDFFKKHSWSAIIIGIFAITAYYTLLNSSAAKMVFIFRNLFMLLMFPVWLSFARFLNWEKESFWYEIITKPAFFIYASHFLCYSVFLHLCASFVPRECGYQPIILLGIYFSGGCLLMGCGYLTLKKTFPLLFRLLTGNRNS